MFRALSRLIFLTLALAIPVSAMADEGKDREDARIARAHDLEQEGDDLAASGQLDQAVERYQHALSLGALYESAYYRNNGGNGTNAITPEGIVVYPAPDGPGYFAGMRDGDVEIAANGKSLVGIPDDEIGDVFFDDTSKMASITVNRNGQTFEVTMPWLDFALADPPFVTAWLPWEWGLVDKEVALYAKGAKRPQPSMTARRVAQKAQDLAKNAKTPAEIQNAADFFTLAEFVAPYWADLDINAAIFQKTIHDPIAAARSLRHYLALEPNGADANAARATLAQMQPELAQELKYADWGGHWHGTNGQSDIDFDRHGNLLTASIRGKPEPFLRAVITDDNTAKLYSVFSDSSGDLSAFPDQLRDAINQCFGGKLEIAGTLRLSEDRQTLTMDLVDFNIDASNCALTTSVTSTAVLQR